MEVDDFQPFFHQPVPLNLTGIDHFHAVLGGTHLGAGTKKDWERALDLLESCRVEKIATSHCTGFHAASFLACRLGDRVSPAAAGVSFEF